MLDLVKEPRYYFTDLEYIINNVFLWIAIGFIGINIAAFVFCMFRGRSRLSDFGSALWINIIGLMIVFGVACAIFGAGIFFSEQNYDIPGYYYGTLIGTQWYIVMIGILTAIGTIAIFIVAISHGIIAAIIAAVIGGGIVYSVLNYGVGFLVYAIIFFVWLILRFIWIVVSTFGVAIYSFGSNHWIILTATLVGPAVLFGLVVAFMDYIRALRNNVSPLKSDDYHRYHKTVEPAFSATANTSTTTKKRPGRKKKVTDEEDALA